MSEKVDQEGNHAKKLIEYQYESLLKLSFLVSSVGLLIAGLNWKNTQLSAAANITRATLTDMDKAKVRQYVMQLKVAVRLRLSKMSAILRAPAEKRWTQKNYFDCFSSTCVVSSGFDITTPRTQNRANISVKTGIGIGIEILNLIIWTLKLQFSWFYSDEMLVTAFLRFIVQVYIS